MKILIAGDWHSELHEEAVYQAFIQLGHMPIRFSWYEYFQPRKWVEQILGVYFKVQNKYMFGPTVNRLNRDFIALVESCQPEIVFVYRGSHVYSKTLKALRLIVPRAILIGYNNDDPFSPHYPVWKWRHFLAGVPEYDLILAYRKHNLNELLQMGAQRVELLRSWFIPERNYPLVLSEDDKEKFGCDVVFIGHYENDGRLGYLEEIVRRGWKLRIYGPGYEWDSVVARSELLKKHAPIQLVWGEDYNRALCGAKIALCFFSRLNRDTYTRRCFEIPASGVLLMSEYSDDLATMFRSGEEALYFRNVPEMSNSIEMLLNNEKMCRSIAQSGRQRVNADGHDVVSRMKDVLGWVDKINRGEY